MMMTTDSADDDDDVDYVENRALVYRNPSWLGARPPLPRN